MAISVNTILESVQPVAVLGAAAALMWYVRSVRQLAWSWPTRRSVSFVLGLVLLLAVTCGPSKHYGQHLYSVWLSQVLALLLIVPILLLAGQPIELARLISDRHPLIRLVQSGPGRGFTSPMVGPALIPLMCVLVLFGPVPGWSVEFAAVNWLVQLAMLVVGCAIVVPLVSRADVATSLAVGAAVAIGFVELLIDAVPGLVMRLSTHPVSSYFAHRRPLAGGPAHLRDQQIAGAVLWITAELVDLPFLLLIFLRWLRADAREAAVVDAALDAQATAVAAHNNGQTQDTPWFLTDPQLKDRLR